MTYRSPICDSRKNYDPNSLALLSKFLTFWFLLLFSFVSRALTLDTCHAATLNCCGSMSLCLLLCTYSSFFLEGSFPSYIFGNFSFFFKSGYSLYLTQEYRHREFWAPIESFAQLYISMYLICYDFIYLSSFPTRVRTPWRQNLVLFASVFL